MGEKDSRGQINLETLPKISLEQNINIDQFINASRSQTRDAMNRGREDLRYESKAAVTGASEYGQRAAPRAHFKALYRNDTFRETEQQASSPLDPGQTGPTAHTRGSKHSTIEDNSELELQVNDTADDIRII